MNNVLIGGSGFIGSFLASKMIARGDRVVSISLSGDGDPDGVKSVIIDLYYQNCPQNFLEAADNVFVLVIGQVREGFDARQEKRIVNNLARFLRSCRARVFFFSSVAVYGETPKKATEATICKPLGAYGRFKLEAEGIFKKHISPQRLVVLRLANIYGSPKNKGFIGLLMDKLSQSRPSVIINGDGKQRRDYVLIDDLVAAVLRIVDQSGKSGIVNISTGRSYFNIEVVNLVSKMSGRNIKMEVKGKMIGEPQNSLIDNTRLQKIFGYQDFTSLEGGLAKTLKRYDAS